VAPTSFDTLQFLKSKLTEAEVANRQAHHDTVFAAYEDIARHYQSQHDYKTTVYFLTKALGVAQLAQDNVREAHANEALGLAKEKMGEIRQAIEYYETHRDLLIRHGLEVPGESARYTTIRHIRPRPCSCSVATQCTATAMRPLEEPHGLQRQDIISLNPTHGSAKHASAPPYTPFAGRHLLACSRTFPLPLRNTHAGT